MTGFLPHSKCIYCDEIPGECTEDCHPNKPCQSLTGLELSVLEYRLRENDPPPVLGAYSPDKEGRVTREQNRKPVGRRCCARTAAAQEEGLVLGWDIIETYGVAVAIPHGTELIAEATIDALIQELRARPPLVDAG